MLEFTFKNFAHDGHHCYGQHGNLIRVHGVQFHGETSIGQATIEIPACDMNGVQLQSNDGNPMVVKFETWCEVTLPGEEPKSVFPMFCGSYGWLPYHEWVKQESQIHPA